MGCCMSTRGNANADEVEINFNSMHKNKSGKSGKGKGQQEAEADDEVCNQCALGFRGSGIQVNPNNNEISGSGTIIGSCPLDCDVGRWEVEILKNITNTKQIQIGIKRFYKHIPTEHLNQTMDQTNQPPNASNETISYFLSDNSLTLKENDVIGVYWDLTDLPMLQFTLNGNLLFNTSVNRIRPSNDMFIAVSLDGQLTNNTGSCKVLFAQKEFHHPPIASKFKMVICSTKLI
jgi:hypothetical protein